MSVRMSESELASLPMAHMEPRTLAGRVSCPSRFSLIIIFHRKDVTSNFLHCPKFMFIKGG
jgi:hypothetical protein